MKLVVTNYIKYAIAAANLIAAAITPVHGVACCLMIRFGVDLEDSAVSEDDSVVSAEKDDSAVSGGLGQSLSFLNHLGLNRNLNHLGLVRNLSFKFSCRLFEVTNCQHNKGTSARAFVMLTVSGLDKSSPDFFRLVDNL